jgi:uncharacterized protein YgfB (UPF0149 family)
MSYRDYDEIRQALSAARSTSEPAEAHGALAGALCASSGHRLEDWIGEILPGGGADVSANALLRELYEQTGRALNDGGMTFRMLLPDDEQPLDRRATALGEWCHGFLYGLGGRGIGDPRRLSDDAGEVVQDIMEITRLAIDADDPDESNERAYAELVEFVRVGVQFLFEDLAPVRGVPREGTPAALH